ncbi:uncharacterized protein LOC131998177 [Stomoxys calcitrans]|uniref:uncharacterized protein LOC131994013 n=1 Tax=Stomoxys calcitrans TaxID=35570 RepID=UPI0027E2EEFB|nr:uncharacterized protein LOC131994013 [Stomoxys calcitrans]XP_059216035.1 uncharacterized protein LOC131994013 [Stomoxys calcitrans]XP_059217600.1 uncharacterized protein LOC131994747 [Stomoxys calcitrans]XP_059221068.1 uncharacterized protein LOC131995858 [Stomoxys calcitrans]XP_059221069.1 uncharacterized protein LOC131995858 [Stomoxys calcitrans]XP_059221070.1 uncharacterized protein LOC131995858 [Stomoxys calcitrans]XP_059224008.1 uncharacterized protein LOC131997305 [Stomoxys calcitran
MGKSSTSSTPKCRICEERHFLKHCPKFQRMPVSERRKVIREKGFCFNCLCTAHTRSWCPSRQKCMVCQQNHHTMVHTDDKSSGTKQQNRNAHFKTKGNGRSDSALRETPVASSRQKHLNERLSRRPTMHVFLPTALARIVTSTGPKKARLLLSSGEAQTVVLKELVERLNVRTTKRDGKEYCCLNLESYHDPLIKIQIHGLVKSQFHTVLPKATNEPKLKALYDHLTDLADPHFFHPSNIEIIVANDQLSKVLRAGLIQSSSNMPLVQSTIFGWVISGACHY